MATDWEADGAGARRPVPAARWDLVDDAVSPGLKPRARAEEKARCEYGGDTSRLCDLARLTAIFASPRRLLAALAALRRGADRRVVGLKNAFASPTPLGYARVRLLVAVDLEQHRAHLCEVVLGLADVERPSLRRARPRVARP